jgi:threonine dehydrogenase-like Zn-dependent dehydrogenase
MRRLVLRNQVLVGSVNASRDHFQLAVDDLVLAETRWPHHVADLITHRHPYADFDAAFQHHGSDEIKVVLEWAA